MNQEQLKKRMQGKYYEDNNEARARRHDNEDDPFVQEELERQASLEQEIKHIKEMGEDIKNGDFTLSNTI